MFFAHLDRAEGAVPLASLPFACDGLHILNHDIGEWQHLLQVHDDTGFGFPSTACRRWDPLLALRPISKPFGSVPLAVSPCPSHGPACLDGSLYMVGCLYHQVDDGLFRPTHTEAFKLAAWINSCHQRLIVRVLLVAQLHVEESELVAFGA